MSARDLADGRRTESPVVVGVDGSRSAIGAARWAAAVAAKLAAPLRILHARPSLGHNISDAIADVRAVEMELERESATAILESARQAAEADQPDLRITTSEVDMPADEALIDLGRTARLIVLGSDEVSLGTAIMIGSTTVTVATHSICPVVAWRGDTAALTQQPILLGIDHDHDSRVAVTAAFEFAHRVGTSVIALHARSTRREAEEPERQHLSNAISPLLQLYPDVRVTEVVEHDKPSRALLRHATDAQLVVVGSRGRGLLASAFLGSTGLNLLHHCAIPVMICRSSAQGD